MEKITIEQFNDKQLWEEFLLSQNPRSFLQSWNWGKTNEEVGKKVFYIAIKEDLKLIGICLAIKEQARRGPHLAISGGPIIDWSNSLVINELLSFLKKLAKEEKCWFIRLRPELLENEQSRQLMKQLHFVSAPMHLHAENTWILDISKSEEELLGGMRKTTRYLVRKGLQANLTLTQTTASDAAKILADLQEETVKRHKFVAFSEKTFRSEIKNFGSDNQAQVFICYQEKEPLAAAIIIFYGNSAYYHYSGSVSTHRDVPFSYYLQWQIILEAKRRGCTYYNFWGIAPNDDPTHRFAGVTLFKTGFGGERVDWLHAHDLPTSTLYWSTHVFEHMRKKMRRL